MTGLLFALTSTLQVNVEGRLDTLICAKLYLAQI